jgi:hypothetical protein
MQKQKQRYRVLLDSLLGLGNTALENSQTLIREAEAIMVIASKAWLTSATKKPSGNIAAEVQEIYSKNTKERTPVVVLPVDAYESLKDFEGWSWSKLNPNWTSGPPILNGLKHSGETRLQELVEGALQDLNREI